MAVLGVRGLLEDDPDTAGTQTEGVWNVVYNVPLNDSDGPHDMDAGSVATWGQAVAPSDATAVLPRTAGSTPATGTTVTAPDPRTPGPAPPSRLWTSKADSSIKLSPVAGISSTGYDEFGHVVRGAVDEQPGSALCGRPPTTS